jgi:hypothetical protein
MKPGSFQRWKDPFFWKMHQKTVKDAQKSVKKLSGKFYKMLAMLSECRYNG